MAEVFPVRWYGLISSTDHDNCLFRQTPTGCDIMRLPLGQGCPHGIIMALWSGCLPLTWQRTSLLNLIDGPGTQVWQ